MNINPTLEKLFTEEFPRLLRILNCHLQMRGRYPKNGSSVTLKKVNGLDFCTEDIRTDKDVETLIWAVVKNLEDKLIESKAFYCSKAIWNHRKGKKPWLFNIQIETHV